MRSINRARIFSNLCLGLVLALLSASAASARLFTVTLKNGTTFETRYPPKDAEWDENVITLVTDQGNLIGLYRDEVADVTSEAETRGYGYQLDTTTLFLGWSPNDLAGSSEEGAEPGPEWELPDSAPAEGYSVQQFVNPGDISGVPIYAGDE